MNGFKNVREIQAIQRAAEGIQAAASILAEAVLQGEQGAGSPPWLDRTVQSGLVSAISAMSVQIQGVIEHIAYAEKFATFDTPSPSAS
jgi:hypothetical protein